MAKVNIKKLNICPAWVIEKARRNTTHVAYVSGIPFMDVIYDNKAYYVYIHGGYSDDDYHHKCVCSQAELKVYISETYDFHEGNSKYFKPIEACDDQVREMCDPKTEIVYFWFDRPLYEYSRRDGKWWWRKVDGILKEPFRAAGSLNGVEWMLNNNKKGDSSEQKDS